MTRSLRFADWSIGAKLMTILLVASTLPLALSSYGAIARIRALLDRDARALVSARADELSKTLDTFHRGYIDAVERASAMPSIVRGAERAQAATPEIQADLDDVLRIYMQSDPAIFSTVLIGADGVVLASTERRAVGLDVSMREYFQDAMRDGAATADVFNALPQVGSIPLVGYVHRVDARDGRALGVMGLFVRADALWSVVRAANGRAGAGSYAVLLDQHGVRIAHSFQPGKVARPTGPVDPAARAKMIAARRFGDATADLLDDPLAVPDLFARATDAIGPTENETFVHDNPLEGARQLVVARRLTTLRWTLFVVVPEAGIAAPIESLVTRLALGGFVLVAMALAFGVLLSRRVLAPLRALSQAADALARDDLTARVAVETGDEIGLLGARFNEMADALVASREGLEQKVRARTLDLEQANGELSAQKAELLAQREELQAQQHELEVQGREVQRADRLKSEFLANMSHELRTPLNSIIGFSDLLRDEAQGSLSPRHVKFVDDVLASGRHLLHLINEILDLSKIEAGHTSLDLRSVLVADAVAESCNLVRPAAARKRMTFREEVDADTLARADPGKLRQILLNLLSNAVKFSPDGSTVTVEARRRGDLVHFAVTDEGPGVEDALLPALFEPFVQGESALVKKHEGTGLGLAICKRLVEMHGGTIGVDRARGGGSVFRFSIPVDEASETPAPAPRDGAGRPSVLLVEEPAGRAASLREALETAGYDVALVAPESDIVGATAERRPIAVLLDPGSDAFDGIAVLDALRRRRETRDVAIVVTTAPSVTDVLAKPVDRDQVIKALAALRLPAQPPRKRVMCIDDDPAVGVLLRSFLEPAGYDVTCAERGRAGLDAALPDPPDVFIVDVMMPDMSGFEVVDELSRDPRTRDAAIIVLTAADLSPEQRAWMKQRVRGLAEKGSFTRADLLAAIARATKQRAAPYESAPVILVADDHDMNRELARSILERKGYRILVAEDGRQAVDVALAELPDLILMDLAMPHKDGFAAARELRAHDATKHIPIVAMTALAMRGDEERARAAGMDGYLAKPVVRESLEALVERFLTRPKT